ncbi:MAG: DapH/DapD/GlmU-related protein [Candidatus Omnitrophica bacterium]|nr:DapH/DapD/GlmU-related protein [Candidatus Omnitrophota bacterium]MDD5737172.1 DapH/DapD/GlmU-related protein [Candidatus Omnitrophota bacterium]
MKWLLVSFTQLMAAVAMYLAGTVFFGLALIPGISIFFNALAYSRDMPAMSKYALLGISLAGGYFLFGLTLILLVGFVRVVLRIRLKEGNHQIFSAETFKWAFISALYLLVNFTFIDFILLTPFANIFLRLLGVKLGKNVQINSKHIYDATLLEIGDNTVIGGGAIIIGHIVERSTLKLRKVKIGKNVTIGSHSTIMPGCEIGDNAIVGAGAVLRKGTKVEPRDIYYGIPAESIRNRHKEVKENGQA